MFVVVGWRLDYDVFVIAYDRHYTTLVPATPGGMS